MTTVDMSPVEQRVLLLSYLNAPHVINRADPFQRQWDDLISECYRRDELVLGCALVSLFTLRCDGLQARAAGLLFELFSSRRHGTANGKGGAP